MILSKILKKDTSDKFIKLEELLMSSIGENDPKTLKTELLDKKWEFLTKTLACPHESFNSLDDYQKPVDNLKKEDFFSKIKNDCPIDGEKERKKEIINLFPNKNGEEQSIFEN